MKPSQPYSSNRPRRPRRVSNSNRRQDGHHNPNKHWESLGPNVRIRGSAIQIYDKYVGLAEDAKRNGDRVLVENLKQHAEYYLRLMNVQQAQHQERQNRQQANAENDSANNVDNAVDTSSREDTNTEDSAIVEDLTPKAVSTSPDTDEADALAHGLGA